MKKITKTLIATAIATAIGLSAPVYAQSSNGYVTGEVLTQVGNVLSDATITITNVNTGLVRSTTSDVNGDFNFPQLPTGQYSIVVSKSGYDTYTIDSVNVTLGGKINISTPLQETGIETIEVRGSAIALVDVTSTTTGIVVDQLTLSKVPVPRDLTGVALLAPGTSRGDTAFGNLPSIGGSSVAENAYFINGLNVTNFRTGVGSSSPPFEFYDTFEVKTGGYSAEFGRATGGVINSTVKSGTNEFKAGVNFFWEPDALRETRPDVFIDGELFQQNSADKIDEFDANLYVSGALIEDKLFFYALFNPRDIQSEFTGGGLQDRAPGDSLTVRTQDDAFWGLNVDWYINENNILNFTAFSDERSIVDNSFVFNADTGVGEQQGGSAFSDRGGDNFIVKYTSVVNDDFSLSAMWGLNKSNRTNRSALDDNPAIYDSRQGGLVQLGNWATLAPESGNDEREVFRVDGTWFAGDHEIRFGLDYEKLYAFQQQRYSGGTYWRYFDFGDDGGEQVRERIFVSGGEFEIENQAFYIQDAWQATDNLVVNLGLRNDTFDNKNADGETFVKLDNQWAPRIGAVWDVNGDGDSKLWASFGQYYLPIAANTNIRLSGAELFTQQFFELEGLNADDSPIIGAPANEISVFGDGSVPDRRSIVDANIEPMRSDEFILGYQFQLNEDWAMGIQGTRRVLSTTIEDVAIDAAVISWAADNGYGDVSDIWTGFHSYVLTNPGQDMLVATDELPGTNGELVFMDLSAERLNYPEAERKFSSIDVTFDRAWDGEWLLSGSYTWSKTYGNSEGFVRSDNGQDDAGLTTNFDQPGLLDGGNGNLPTDRRHRVVLFGAYQLVENVNVGANFTYQSGRPINAFGGHPTDQFAAAYGAESFYQGGELRPRGSLGTTNSTWQLDLSASYTAAVGDFDVLLRADIFNVFNNDKATEVYEIADDEFFFESTGDYRPDPRFLSASSFQIPRSVRLSASIEF